MSADRDTDGLTKRAAHEWRTERDAKRNKQDEPPAGLSFDQIVEWTARRETRARRALAEPVRMIRPANRHERGAADHEADREREALRRRFPDEFGNGVKCGLLRERGGYPEGFCGWPRDRRNAWFGGFNFGFHERRRLEAAE
jgi:hypothetical protein